MINKLRSLTPLGSRANRDAETGSDVVTTLFMIPFFVALLFGIVDVSSYFQTKTQVQNITRDGARMVALMGGAATNNPLNQEKFKDTGGLNITTYVANRLSNGEGCIYSGCVSPPVVSCGPNKATSLNQDAFCQVTYKYQGVGGSIVAWLGFNEIVDQTIKAKETFKVETVW